MEKANIGLIGLAVMGENLVLNMESKGFKVAVFNRTTKKVDDFISNRGKNKNIIPCYNIEEFCANIATPRKIMLMVKAGNPVDLFIDKIVPFLDKGDIIIDGGNSYFSDTIRRTKNLEEKEILFVGAGVSGGEEGALKGPSIMPGGNKNAWEAIKPIFQKISAKVANNTPCCEWVGNDGAGHYVKMIHNGIEYGDMQMICEAYSLMKNIAKLSNLEMANIFKEWNKGELNSYLIEITGEILSKKDDKGEYIIDYILDTAGQKGTGKWTSQNALDLGVPSMTIAEAVFARCISALKDERINASKILSGPKQLTNFDKKEFIENIRQALFASKICSYAQGFQLLKTASKEYNWDLNYGDIALMWRGGCIIRASFLKNIKESYDNNANLANLLLAPYFKNIIDKSQDGWRKTIIKAVESGIPTPTFSSALSYYDSYRSEKLPANLLQAQRDYFGAHTYERTDKKQGDFYHTNWI